MDDPQRRAIGHYRWVICALLFFATTINYVDRAVIGILKPNLMEELHWNEVDFSIVIMWFSFAYAIGYAVAGRFMDWMGTRVGYAIAVFVWSLAAMAHGFNQYIATDTTFQDWLPFLANVEWEWVARMAVLPATVVGFSIARMALGLSEGGNFPACVKSVSEWFPSKERALATGLFNAGSNVGMIVAPIMVPLLTYYYGWAAAFYVTGALGFIWVVFWLLYYNTPEKHPKVGAAELELILSDPPDPPVHISWLSLLKYRQTWAFIVGMAISAPIWWFYLFWAAGFFHDKFGIDLKSIGIPLVTIYLLADVGSIAGGWLSGFLINRGWSVNAARKTALLVCALCVVPVFTANMVPSAWMATLLIALAASAHQGFSANLYTLVSDTAPRKVVSSIVGLGGMAAGFVAMGFQRMTGSILDAWPDHGYTVILAIASCSYLVNLLLIHLINPRLEPMQIPGAEASA
jgi:ACS family hexuronate transporter-like MFS transporter